MSIRTRLLLLLAAACCALAPALLAQTVQPILVAAADAPDPGQRLQTTRVAVDALISGGFAHTSVTLTFRNPGSRAIAGDLIFPLPERAVLSGYALDVDGVMVDGVGVDRQRARVVFERIVRQGIDPGLVEWLAGNNFRTRVFPIFAGGTRTIRVDYLLELEEIDDASVYRLPLHYDRPIADLSLRVEVLRSDRQPQIKSSPVSSLSFATWRDSWVAETSLRNVAANRELRVDVPDARAHGPIVEEADGQTYFVVRDHVDVPRVQETIDPPARVALYWDASFSRLGGDHDRLPAILEGYFRRNARDVTVDLHVLRNEAESARSYRVRNGDAGSLLGDLRSLAYDGATQLGAMATPRRGTDFAIVVSDGHGNFGEDLPDLSAWPATFTISAQTGANHGLLRQLAARTGGAYLNINRVSDAEAGRRIGVPPYRLIDVQVASGLVRGVTPTSGVVEGSVVTVAGLLDSQSATLVLRYGLGDRVLSERRHTIERTRGGAPLGAIPRGEVGRLVWALNTLAELEPLRRSNRAAIRELGRTHGLVTPETSLIVLESLEQYVEHRIQPPVTLPAMRQAYRQRVAALTEEKNTRQRGKLDRVVARWNDRIAWWQTDFSRIRVPKPDNRGGAAASESTVAQGEEPPAPEPEPDAAPEAEMSRTEDRAAAGMSASDEESERFGDEGGEDGDGADGAPSGPRISLEPWDPNTPYLASLRAAKQEKALLYEIYLRERREHGDAPAFYLDVGDYLLGAGFDRLAVRVWSTIAELELEDPALLRVLAHRLAQRALQDRRNAASLLDQSRRLFDQVLELRPEEPQSYRDLALVLGDLASAAATRMG